MSTISAIGGFGSLALNDRIDHWHVESTCRSGMSAQDFPAASDRWGRRGLALILLLATVRLFITWPLELTDTEAYYVAWARWPSLSYYDHPPLIAWMSWLASHVASSAFVLRLVPAACVVAFQLAFHRFARRMFAPRAAFLALVIVSLLPAFIGVGSLVNPEAILAPLWMLGLTALYDLREHDEPWRPIVLGAAIGVAFLAKYTALLAVPLSIAWIASSRETRRWLRRPSFYLAGLVALAFASPVIVWNAQRGFPSVTLHLVERVAAPSLATYASSALRTLLSQIVIFHPLVCPGFIVVAALCFSRARSDHRFRFLAWTSVPMLAFFFTMMLRVRDAEPHWTIVGYVPLAIAMGALLDEVFEQRRTRVYVWAVVGCTGTALAVFLLGNALGYAPWADGANETYGWRDITGAIRRNADALGDGAVVASNHNVLCGHLEYALHDSPNVYCASERRTEFDFVGRREIPAETPVVYVDSERYPLDPSVALEGRSCTLGEHVDVTHGGRVVQRMRIWSCPADHTRGRERQAER